GKIMNSKKAIVLNIVILLLAGWLISHKISRAKCFAALKDSLFLELEIPEYFEAREQTLDVLSLINRADGEELFVSSKTFDLSRTGVYWLRISVSSTDDYNQKAEQGYSFPIIIRDTIEPVITFRKEKISFIAGESFDPLSNISSVTDLNFPDLEYSENLTQGKYTVKSDIDNKKPGNYIVTVMEMDSNGNR
ncbi:MAG: hypothetical protein II126_05940, partial [Erysipelotrichaceae bacterium]|nr:hypothetical protein [Erysipelotrichaceae bacterium]